MGFFGWAKSSKEKNVSEEPAPEIARSLRPSDPGYWDSPKPGDSILLRDEQALLDAGGRDALDYIVREIWTLRQQDDLCIWKMILVEGHDEQLIVSVLIVDGKVDITTYFPHEDWSMMDREEMLQSDWNWMLDPDFLARRSNEFAYAKSWSVGENDKETYVSGSGTLAAEIRYSPRKSGINVGLAFVTEYETEAEADNPRAMILEIDHDVDKDGEVILLYLGSPMRPGDVELQQQ